MKINIIFQDEYMVVVEKPAWLLVHPNRSEAIDRVTLMSLVRDQINRYLYPIHRLDRQVSGIVIFGLDKLFTRKIKELWHTTMIKKHYLALVRGQYEYRGQLDFPLSNSKKVLQTAITKYIPLDLYTDSTLVEIEILTGRTHQIRRHFARSVNHLLGDRKYGKKKYNDLYLDDYKLSRIFLHSHRFELTHPITDKKMVFESPLAQDLQNTLSKITKNHIKRIYEINKQYLGKL